MWKKFGVRVKVRVSLNGNQKLWVFNWSWTAREIKLGGGLQDFKYQTKMWDKVIIGILMEPWLSPDEIMPMKFNYVVAYKILEQK